MPFATLRLFVLLSVVSLLLPRENRNVFVFVSRDDKALGFVPLLPGVPVLRVLTP